MDAGVHGRRRMQAGVGREKVTNEQRRSEAGNERLKRRKKTGGKDFQMVDEGMKREKKEGGKGWRGGMERSKMNYSDDKGGEGEAS